MNNRYLLVILSLILISTFSACSSKSAERANVSELSSDYTWRIAALSCGEFNYTHYKYDSDGHIDEIIEYENIDPNYYSTNDTKSVSCNRIKFDDSGNITSVTTSIDGMSAEVINGHTWRLYSDSYSYTATYNDNYMLEMNIMNWVGEHKITNKTTYDASGKAISCISELEMYFNDNVSTSIFNYEYEYEYDSNGNPIIQFEISEQGKNISAIYSWEH